MKNLNELNQYRIPFRGYMGDEQRGVFKIFIGGRSFYVIASVNMGWEHVSVSAKGKSRCPTWEEMCAVKNLFFAPEEVVMQLHPAQAEYVNVHPYCLHLWKPLLREIPTPPAILV